MKVSVASARRRLITLLGAAGFVVLMAAGYAYNVTLIQLGLPDLGGELGLTDGDVALAMAGLAVVTTVTALGIGVAMARFGWSRSFRAKMRIVAVSVAMHALLVMGIGLVQGAVTYWAWLAGAALALGAGIPASFGLIVDLVPVRWRGYAAAFITAAAYGGATLLSGSWSMADFAGLLRWPMVAGGATLVALAVVPPHGPLGQLAAQHRDPHFGHGRFLSSTGRRVPRRLLVAVGVMFVVYFIDSLGFLRMAATPEIVAGSWQSLAAEPRLVIAGAHVIGALVAGILYTELDERPLFAAIFGIFALAQLTYVWDARFLPGTSSGALGLPALYAIGVSLYTVVNFAIWADLATPRTISVNAAVGVACSAWTATFLSSAVAIWWAGSMSLERHLSWVAAIALLGLAALLLVWWLQPGYRKAAE